MGEGLPPISLELNDGGSPVVIVDDTPVNDAAQLVELAPALADPKWARAYARILNHITNGYEYSLITDPAAFREEYMATYEAEDPDEDPVAGVIRLHNYGLPDFDAIHAPENEGDKLVFFVKENYIGIPYRVTMTADGPLDYEPLGMVAD